MAGALPSSDIILRRMVDAVEEVRRRMVRACCALEGAGVRYALVGGNAVAAWVATVDEGAVRNTRDVDLMIRRSDLSAARAALESTGFRFCQAAGMDMFLDGPDGRARSAVHIVFAGEFVRPGEPAPNPDVLDSTDLGAFRVINLEALVRIKLTAYHDKDRTHLRDLIETGLVDRSWADRLPPVLAQRLAAILDTPGG
ncbi:MAG TPA: hypothetical protein DEB06_01120 [Phycisphaerales bacterium]|nr:hypothetical protein [Phycisphaerales bacterium]